MENMLENVVASRKLAYLHSYLSLAIFNSFYNERNVKDLRLPSSIEFLLTKIKLHFVNQNSHANFKEFPASEKIISIGGILVEQNKILIQEKVKADDNEAIYAGVPLICIPNNADQFYLSSLVEHLGIGIYVKVIFDESGVDIEAFGVDFQNALNKMMIDDNIYQKTANELRTKILLDLNENGPKKNIFLKMISEVIGYLNAGNGNLFHYIFAESQGNSKTDPLVLWLNGGPGCSSLGGLFNELGPYLLNEDGKTLRQNPHSWNKYASIIFLESPAWVGFSYNAKVKNVTTGDEEVAAANYAALKDFFTKYPSFKTNPFYLTGESYAGVYIPMLGVKILEGIKDSKINLKGVAIGNGLVSDSINTNTQILYLYNHDSCDIYNIPDNSTCGDMQQNLYTGYDNNLVNPYDLYDDCGTVYDDCVSSAEHYLNMPNVKEALHIPSNLNIKWEECSDYVFNNYTSTTTIEMANFTKIILNANIRMLFYYGDLDVVCNFLLGQRFTEQLGFKVGKHLFNFE
uniref:Carboxypeptidase n=1 Tax=Meloidogyne javanica TaxID=6303 RepID=A0A915LN84_MELJA